MESIAEKMAKFLKFKYLWFIGQQISLDKSVPSQNDFARFLGISSTALSLYINANRKPSGAAVFKLADKLGPEVYDILEMPRAIPNDEDLRFIIDHWWKLNDDMKNSVMNEFKEHVIEITKKNG